jgi:uncharacterized protein
LRTVLTDTAHYIALLIPSDDLHTSAMTVARSLGDVQFMTTEAVLTEVLAYVAERGPVARTKAVAMIDELRADRSVTIVGQSSKLFEAGLDLYRRRPDKGYSLTDCMSMVVCKEEAITDVLTHDQHFEQEGFTILL